MGCLQFINLATGSDLRVGTGPESCTVEVKFAEGLDLGGREVILIDIPGFDDTTKGDMETLNIIAAFLTEV